jgi:ABC-type uncharacterized transport system auxiliary subunit
MNRFAKGAILVVVFAAGCTTARAPRYYFLTPSPVAPQANATQFPVAILVGRLSAPRILRDDRVIYGMTDVELGVDEYHRWTEPPTEMIEQLLVERLREPASTSPFRKFQPARGDYLLRGRLSAMNEVDDPAGIKARCHPANLIKGGSVVWTDSYTHDELVDKKSVTAVVRRCRKTSTPGWTN